MLQMLAGTALVAQVVWVIACLLRREVAPLPKEEGRVTNPRYVLWIGVVIFVLLMIPAVICVTKGVVLWWAFIPLISAALTTAGCLPCIRWNAESVTVRTFFGRTHTFAWLEVENVSRTFGDSWLTTTRGRFFIDGVAEGRVAFIVASARRGKVGKNAPAPFDVFRGHVRESGGMLAGLAIIGLVGVVLLCIGLGMLLSSDTEENTQPVSILAERWEEGDDHFDLYSGENIYRVQYDERKMARRFADVEPPVTLEARVRPGRESIKVYALTVPDGTALLTLEEVNRNSREVGAFLLGMVVLCAGVIAMTILVGRHPERYPVWVHNLLFKPGTLVNVNKENANR